MESGDNLEIFSIKETDKFLTEYIELCNDEWGISNKREQTKDYLINKKKKILNDDKVISVLGLIDNKRMLGFISLFKYDGDERCDLSPWYATMYIKKEYRGLGYSKLLNDAILKEALKLGYKRVYLKTDLVNYYEKFGAKYLEQLKNGENLYYFDVEKD